MPGRYAANAAAMWTGLGPTRARVLRDTSDLLAVWNPHRGRFRTVLRRPVRELPLSARELLAAGRPGTIEDPFGRLGAVDAEGARTARLLVMARPAAPVRPAPPKADLQIVPATGRREREDAESVIVHGFPYIDLWPFTAGRLLPRDAPPPGLRVWLARRQRVPAAACCVYDDGATAGVYWLTTLPEQRGRGIAAALLARALAEHQDRTVILTTAPTGAPRYAELGFVEVSEARWHTRR